MTKTEEIYIKRGVKIKGSKKCECCGVEFYIFWEKQKTRFCSVKCRTQVIRPRKKEELKMIKNCEFCGNEIKIFLKQNIKRKRFCSKECRAKGIGRENSIKMELGLMKKISGHTPESMAKFKQTCLNRDIKRITPLRRLIQSNEEYYKWRSSVFARDNYKCCNCGNNKDIHAHHIKHFSILFKEFLLINSHLDIKNNKDELFRLAINYEPFWEINNGKTLCAECHQKEHPKLNIIKNIKNKKNHNNSPISLPNSVNSNL